jgi:hypothetical protein
MRNTFGAVAQLAERFLCKEEDEGSNPFSSTKIIIFITEIILVY